MKYVIFSLCLLFTSNLYSQRKKKVKAQNYLQIQGGYLVDNNFDNSYKGFNIINAGWSQINNKIIQSIQLELIAFKLREEEFFMNTLVSGIENKRQSVEILYNYSFILTGDGPDGLYFGPSASFFLNSLKTIPLTSASFPINQNCYCIGIGVNGGYNFKVGKRMLVGINSRLMLFDIGWNRQEIENPLLIPRQRITSSVNADLLRKQLQLMVSLAFEI